MQKWEYLTMFLHADTKTQLEELKRRFPTEKTFVQFSPRSLIPSLDKLGEEGWELISMQPVYTGERGDLLLFQQYATLPAVQHNPWTHTYLCTFKRPKESTTAAMP
ncbi:MAG: hypothetical protein FJ009_02410 [Chloroflexi bacterium]|nr:hypothetical protein [Chloroflexota bacterium]